MNEPITAVRQSWLSSHKRNTRNTSMSNYIIILSVKIDAHPIRTKLFQYGKLITTISL